MEPVKNDTKLPLKRIGLLGCSNIAPVSLIRPVDEIENLQVHAVAARDFDRAKQYADEYRIPHVYAGYDDLLQSGDIDFVYIPLANHVHKEWALRAAMSHKHILLEKPVCLRLADFYEIQQACIDHGVHLLEAIMVQHHPWQSRVKKIVEQQPYGRLIQVHTQISHPMRHRDNYRFYPQYGGGAFHDEGPYWLQFIQSIAGLQPLEVYGESAFDGPHRCDWNFRACMKLPNRVEAYFCTSFEQPYQAMHRLEFEQANVRIKDFFRARLGHFKIAIEVLDKTDVPLEKIHFTPQNYYVNQLRFFSDVIDGLQDNIPYSHALERTRVLEAIYQSAKEKVAP